MNGLAKFAEFTVIPFDTDVAEDKIYVWKKNKKQDVGFIAQEVEEIIPEIIETSKGFLDTEGHQENEIKDMKTIAYPKLIPYLVDTIQVMEKRIKELEKKVK